MVADKGYRYYPNQCTIPSANDSAFKRWFLRRVQGRHEVVNGKMKVFGCLKKKFIHKINKHKSVFNAVAVVVQLAIMVDERLFDTTGPLNRF